MHKWAGDVDRVSISHVALTDRIFYRKRVHRLGGSLIASPLTGLILRQQLLGIKDGDISKGEEEEESRQRREVGFLSGADKSSSRPSDRSRHTCSIFVYFKLPIQQQLRHVAHFASFFLLFLFLLTLFHLSSAGAASSSSPIAHVPFDPLLCCCCWPQSLEIR